jgi:hypothetical protein
MAACIEIAFFVIFKSPYFQKNFCTVSNYKYKNKNFNGFTKDYYTQIKIISWSTSGKVQYGAENQETLTKFN